METAPIESGLTIKKLTVEKSHMSEIEDECCNKTEENAIETSDPSICPLEHENKHAKENCNPHLSSEAAVSDEDGRNIYEYTVKDGCNHKDNLLPTLSKNCEQASNVTDSEVGSSIEKCSDSQDQSFLTTDIGQKGVSLQEATSIQEPAEISENITVYPGHVVKNTLILIEENREKLDISRHECSEVMEQNKNQSSDYDMKRMIHISDSCLNEVEEPHNQYSKNKNLNDAKAEKLIQNCESAPSIQPQIFEDITEDEDEEEYFENIELELDDLIHPAEFVPSTNSNEQKKYVECSAESVDYPECFETETEVDCIPQGDDETTGILQHNGERAVMTKSADVTSLKTDSYQSDGLKQSKSSRCTIIRQDQQPEKNTQGNIYTVLSSTSSSGAACRNIGEMRNSQKQKFTARKSGKTNNEIDRSSLKTISLHPVKNITMKLSDVKEALEYNPTREMSSAQCRVSDSDVSETDNVLKKVDLLELNLEKNMMAKKNKKKKNFADLLESKKKSKLTRLDEFGSSVGQRSLSGTDFHDLNMHKDSLSEASFEPSQSKAELSLESGKQNSPVSLLNNIKSSNKQLSPVTSSVDVSLSPCSSVTSSRPAKGKNKMKSVLDMLHARSKLFKFEQEKNADTQVANITSGATSTTTILVSPPPNKPIIEGVKRKGTPKKRKEEVICLSDSEDSGDKRVTVEGKKRKLTVGSILSSSFVPTSVPQEQTKQKLVSTGAQAPVVMVVAQHSSAPGLRSLLPRHAFLSTAGPDSGKIVQSAQGTMVGSLPLISTLPVGAKAISLASLPSGITAVPITTLPSGSQPTMTFFTTVPASVATAVPIPISGTNLVSITSPTQLINFSSSKSLKTTSTLASPGLTSQLPSKTSSAITASTNSDSLRALLVGKSCAFTPISGANSTQLASTPMLFHMVSATGTSLISYPAQSVSIPTSTASNMLKPISTLTQSKSNCSSLRHFQTVIQNGVACLSPPKTPDADSSSEVAVAACLSRPVAGQVEDSEVIPLCCCRINGASFKKFLFGITYCQAVDTVDNKVLGCCNKVTDSQLVRPGVKIPFMSICEVHHKRLKLHQCCPGCGHFCTQGKFQQCKKNGKSSVHIFHKSCVFFRGGKYYCPHCGEETNQCEVELQLSEDKPEQTVILSCFTKNNAELVTARISCKKILRSNATTEEKTIMLPDDRVINIEDLPLGPDRQTIVKLFQCTHEERPKKCRMLTKDLYTPACEGDLEKVFFLLVDGMNANTKYEIHDHQTAMHAAAISGSIGVIFLLLQYGAEIHVQDRSLKTPIICAAENGNLKVVQFLIKVGAKVEDKSEDGMTSLHYAAKAGYIDIVLQILETGRLDVNIQDNGGWTPIMWATDLQLSDVVKYLLMQGGDPNKKDNEKNTSLHWAAYSGSLTIAEMFLDRGCEINAINEHGDTPLLIAARQDHYSMVVLLLARGADIDARNNKNESAIEVCANKSTQVWMVLKVNLQLRSYSTWNITHPEQLVERDITMGREKNPIACVNSEDNELCPVDYLYVTKNVETSPLNINYVITSLQSCRCKDDCSSMYCVCGRSSIKCWYDKVGRLLDEVNLLEPPLVFECNRACRCWVNCNNRVVQNGITCRLQMFKTNGRGWGVRALMDIPKGTFVCEYIGELISDSEADRREDDSYLFDLDNKDGDTYCIDARKYGNISRFINHLCEPNLVTVKVFVEHQDLRFPRICLFSSRDINAYEELGFDYGEKFWMIKWKHFTCACKSAKCKYSSETIKKTLADYKLRYPDETVE